MSGKRSFTLQVNTRQPQDVAMAEGLTLLAQEPTTGNVRRSEGRAVRGRRRQPGEAVDRAAAAPGLQSQWAGEPPSWAEPAAGPNGIADPTSPALPRAGRGSRPAPRGRNGTWWSTRRRQKQA